ncbi:MAG: outer membrane beta-barrel protein [Bacteroidota bacterium]
MKHSNQKTDLQNLRLLKRSLALSFVLLSFFSLKVAAQEDSGFGIKGGINYNANGDYFESIGSAAEEPDRTIGYHVGVFGKFGSKFYLRPEVVYTSIGSDYDNDDFRMQKIDVPVLVGLKVIGPLTVFGGPSFQYILDTEFDGISIDNVEDDFSIGLNFGIGFNLGKIGVDLRYERGFSENESTFINTNLGQGVVSRLDTRPDQLILSLSAAF